MKTMNSVQKTAVSPLIITISFLLGTLCADAQKMQYNGQNRDDSKPLALLAENARYGKPVLSVSADTRSTSEFAAYLEPAAEEPLEMESWMINDTASESAPDNTESAVEGLKKEVDDAILIMLYLENEKEAPLQLENWMTDDTHFNKGRINSADKKNMRKKVVISTGTFIFQDVDDYELKIESWMLSDVFWNQ